MAKMLQKIRQSEETLSITSLHQGLTINFNVNEQDFDKSATQDLSKHSLWIYLDFTDFLEIIFNILNFEFLNLKMQLILPSYSNITTKLSRKYFMDSAEIKNKGFKIK